MKRLTAEASTSTLRRAEPALPSFIEPDWSNRNITSAGLDRLISCSYGIARSPGPLVREQFLALPVVDDLPKRLQPRGLSRVVFAEVLAHLQVGRQAAKAADGVDPPAAPRRRHADSI